MVSIFKRHRLRYWIHTYWKRFVFPVMNPREHFLYPRIYKEPDFCAKVRERAVLPKRRKLGWPLDGLDDFAIFQAFFVRDTLFRPPDRDEKTLLPKPVPGVARDQFLEVVARRPDSEVLRFGKLLFDFWDGQYFKTADGFQAFRANPEFFSRYPDWRSSYLVRNPPPPPQPDNGEAVSREWSPSGFIMGGQSMGKTIFCSCDGLYFEVYARSFADSLAKNGQNRAFGGLFFYVVNPLSLFWQTCQALRHWSQETGYGLTIYMEFRDPMIDASYFNLVRFMKIGEFQKKTGDDYFVCDIDAYVKHDGVTFPRLPMIRDRKVSFSQKLTLKTTSNLPWHYIPAGRNWLPCSDQTTQFLNAVNHYIDQVSSFSEKDKPGEAGFFSNTKRSSRFWDLDQLALLYGYLKCADAGWWYDPENLGNKDLPLSAVGVFTDLEKRRAFLRHPIAGKMIRESKPGSPGRNFRHVAHKIRTNFNQEKF